MERVFVVGCPRSGTTLLQSLLGAHRSVHTMPETHFFDRVLMRRQLQRFGRVRLDAHRVLPHLAEAGVPFRVPRTGPVPSTSARRWTAAFVEVLDRQATVAGAQVWVEKTPIHLHYVDAITALVPGARFVHIVRAGPATIRSLVQVRTANGADWMARRWDDQVTWCTARWIDDLRRSSAALGRPGHTHVRYEDVVKAPAEVLTRLLAGLDLDASPGAVQAALDARVGSAEKVTLADESWKARNNQDLTLVDRHGDVLTADQEERVRRETSAVEDLLARIPRVDPVSGPQQS